MHIYRYFAAIAHQVRRRIRNALRDGEQCVTSLAALFALTRPAIPQHLWILREAGLVSIRHKGREHWYQLQPGQRHQAHAWLGQYEHF